MNRIQLYLQALQSAIRAADFLHQDGKGVFESLTEAYAEHAAESDAKKWVRFFHVQEKGLSEPCRDITAADIQQQVDGFAAADLFYEDEDSIDFTYLHADRILGEQNYWTLKEHLEKLTEEEFQFVLGE